MSDSAARLTRVSRRGLFKRMVGMGALALLSPLTAACRAQVVEVERVVRVEKEVTKIVTEIVKQTVVVERTSVVPQTTPSPTPLQPSARLTIQGIHTPWTFYFQRMTPAFEELFGVSLKWQPLGHWEDYVALVDTQQAAGTQADLIEAPAGVVPVRWDRVGMLSSMTTLSESGAIEVKDMLAPCLDAFSTENNLIGLPFLVHGGDHLLGYQPDLIASFRAPQPDAGWTLPQLSDLNAALAQDPQAPAGFGTTFALPDALPLLRLFDIRLFGAQGDLAIDPDRLYELIAWAKSMARSTRANEPDVLLSPVQALESGQLTATCISLAQFALWEWGVRQQDAQQPRYAATLFPKRQGQSQRAISINAQGYCLSSAAKDHGAAAQWLKYVSGREMGVQLFLQGLAEPGCRAASWSDPRVTDIMPLCSAIAGEMEQAEPASLPASLKLEDCLGIWNKYMPRILAGGSSPDAHVDLMLADMTEAAQRAL